MATTPLPKFTWVDLGSNPISIQSTTNTPLWVDMSPTTPDNSIKGKNVVDDNGLITCYPEAGERIFAMAPFDDADITTRPA